MTKQIYQELEEIGEERIFAYVRRSQSNKSFTSTSQGKYFGDRIIYFVLNCTFLIPLKRNYFRNTFLIDEYEYECF
jgi:hypothetical protein